MCTVDSSSVKPRKSHKTVWCTCLFFISMTFISIYRLRFGDFFSISLREKCPNTELFLVSIFLYSDWIRRFTPKISVFSLNTGKYGLEITPYLDTFLTVYIKHYYEPCMNFSILTMIFSVKCCKTFLLGFFSKMQLKKWCSRSV